AAFIAEMKSALDRVKMAAPRSADDHRLTDHKTVQQVERAIDYLDHLAFKDTDGDAVRSPAQTIADGLMRLKAHNNGTATAEDVVLSEHGVVRPIGQPDQPRQLPAANVSAIGRALFSDHLLAVEIAGTLLLIATVGAIAIAGRREGSA